MGLLGEGIAGVVLRVVGLGEGAVGVLLKMVVLSFALVQKKSLQG